MRIRRSKVVLLITSAFLALMLPSIAQALPSSVHAPLINFERDAATTYPNGFSSVDNSITHFVDSLGADLSINDASPQTIGLGLRIAPDDGSRLIMTFDVPIKRLSLTFGNDDPNFTLDGDVAQLDALRGGVVVDSTSVVMNRNDAADQIIGVGGTKFKRAEFVFARGNTPLDLIERLDNFRVSPACTIRGTNARDVLGGTAKSNSICGLDGNDRLDAKGKNDFAAGGGGKDRVKGGLGADTLLGGSGADVIRAVDGVDGNDTVYGGAGNDTCYIDNGDHQLGCEDVLVPV